MSGANTRSVLARFFDNNWEKGKYFVKTFCVKNLNLVPRVFSLSWGPGNEVVKNLCGRGRGVRARAGWRVWDVGNGTIMLRKAKKCFGKELPPLSNFIQTKKKFCRARKGLGTSLALQCYTGFVSSGFPSKIAQEKRDEVSCSLFSFLNFLSLPTQQDCVLPVQTHTKKLNSNNPPHYIDGFHSVSILKILNSYSRC